MAWAVWSDAATVHACDRNKAISVPSAIFILILNWKKHITLLFVLLSVRFLNKPP